MTMSNEATQYFKKVAGEWDALRSGYFGDSVRESTISKAYLTPDMVLANIGAGTGFMAAGLAHIVQQVHAVDGSAEMLSVARKNLQQFPNVQFHLADGRSLPIPDGTIDVAFANMYLHHCPDPADSIKEMVRILKPGGRIVITDLDTHTHDWLKEEMADEWMGFDRNQLREWFKDADLVNVIVDDTSQSCCAESRKKTTNSPATDIRIFVATGTRRLMMKEAVKETYGSLASQGGSCCSPQEKAPEKQAGSCCGDSASVQSGCSCGQAEPAVSYTETIGYSAEEMSEIPQDAEEISLGCGNPIALANLKEGEVVVDIGSGGGIDSFLAAKRVGLSGRVIGVDMTPAMLARARETAKKSSIPNVEFRFGQAEALPVDDLSVDVVISNCVINLCEDKGLAFREAYRILKPGGRLEVSDIVSDKPFSLEDRTNLEGWASCITGSLPEREYLDLISQAGFDQIRVRRSQSYGDQGSFSVYSAIVSARKTVK